MVDEMWYNVSMSTKYTKELLSEAAQNSESIAGVLRYLNLKQAGGTQSHIGRKLKEFEIDTSHFTGARWNKGKTFKRLQKKSEDILIVLPEGSLRPRVKQLRRAMLESGVEMKCRCGLTDEWQGAKIVLEVDHIDGNWLNNQLENLRFLCPNCHSQEPTCRSWKNTAQNNKQ